MNEECSGHAVSFRWEGFDPVILLYCSGRMHRMSLDSVDFTASPAKHCVGTMNGSEYIPCPYGAETAQCAKCRPAGIPVAECVFEPQCHGERCSRPAFCTRPHAVYLALYSNLIKVGMTSQNRFSERITEQGADAAAVIFHCNSRKEARGLEKEISSRFRIPQDIKPQKLMRQWITPPSQEQMASVYNTYLNRIASWKKPLGGDLQIFDKYPIISRPKSPPKIVQSCGRHAGELLGIKGRYMVYRSEKGPEAVDLSDLIGRDVCARVQPEQD